MPHSKPSISTGAPVGSATAKAPALISKRKAAHLAAAQIPTLPGTSLVCASVNAIVRSASQAQRAATARGSTSRRKDLRRSAKSPPPQQLQFYFSFPSSSTDTATSPAVALGTGSRTEVDQIQHAAPPRPTRPDNDLRNRLDKRRSALTGAASALDTAPPRNALNPPPAAPASLQAPRLSELRRLALPTPGATAAAAPAPTPVPRAPRPSTAWPPPPAVAPGNPSARAATRANKKRRILQFAQLLLEVLPAHPTTRRHETSSGAASAARPPSPQAFIPTSPLFAPPPEPTATAPPADHSAPRCRVHPNRDSADPTAGGRVTRPPRTPGRHPRPRRRRRPSSATGPHLTTPWGGRPSLRYGHLAAGGAPSSTSPAGSPPCGYA
jgi:hypothetical protein